MKTQENYSAESRKKKLFNAFMGARKHKVGDQVIFLGDSVPKKKRKLPKDQRHPEPMMVGVIVQTDHEAYFLEFPNDKGVRTSWVSSIDCLSKITFDTIVELLLTARLRENCEPLGNKGDTVKINDDDYINVNNIMYLHSDYFFDLI